MERVLKMDRPRGAGRFLSLTALWAEGCGGGFAIGHAYGVRVDGVQKVQKVQRVWWRLTPQIKKGPYALRELHKYFNHSWHQKAGNQPQEPVK